MTPDRSPVTAARCAVQEHLASHDHQPVAVR